MFSKIEFGTLLGATFTQAKSSLMFLQHNFIDFMEKEPYTQFLWCFDQFSRSSEIAKFWIQPEWHHTRVCTKHFLPVFLYLLIYLFCIFCWFYGKRTFYTVLWSFWPFLMNLWSYKFLVIKLCLDESDVIHSNEYS